jgi:hypothetical protein
MFYAIARAVSLGLPWLAVMAISATMAYGMNMVMTSGVPIATRADKSVSIVSARPVGSDASVSGAWSVYVGRNCWIPDPSGLEPCVTETSTADH